MPKPSRHAEPVVVLLLNEIDVSMRYSIRERGNGARDPCLSHADDKISFADFLDLLAQTSNLLTVCTSTRLWCIWRRRIQIMCAKDVFTSASNVVYESNVFTSASNIVYESWIDYIFFPLALVGVSCLFWMSSQRVCGAFVVRPKIPIRTSVEPMCYM